MRKKEYCRWDYDDETEISEQLTLEDNQIDYEHGRDTPTNTTTFSQPSLTIMGSHIQRKKGHRRVRIKEKVQIVCLSATILLIGFITGFHIGARDAISRNNNSSVPFTKDDASLSKFSNDDTVDGVADSTSSFSHEPSSQETNEPSPPSDISSDSIRDILKRMSQKLHRGAGAGTMEGKSMAMAIRDLWRSYGLSVTTQQHKTMLTKMTTVVKVFAFQRFEAELAKLAVLKVSCRILDSGVTGASYTEVLDNGSVVFRTSDDNLNSRPFIAFSPAADVNGTSLIYANYGRMEDWEFLKNSRIVLNRSIALIRFGRSHPSRVAAIASAYGIKALLFYMDPSDYGAQQHPSMVRTSSLLTLGQIHEFQKHKSKFIIPAHTVSSSDAAELLRSARQGNWMKRAPQDWQGGLKATYFLGPGTQSQTKTATSYKYSPLPSPPPFQIRLRIFNEPTMATIFNVVGSIPGAWESDRYVIVGCSHDGGGAGEPGMGIALMSELARSFSNAVQKGWRPQRSILFISWDASLFAHSGVSHWLQEHHFEIASRTIAYIDVSPRALRGNETLHVHSSPILYSVARKAISRVIHGDSENGGWRNKTPLYFSSLSTSDEPGFAFLGNLGIPFIRICLSNNPKSSDYALYNTQYDTFENYVDFVDLKQAETLGRIMLETIVLLADSSVLPINVEDYVVEIQKGFGIFLQNYQQDLVHANLSIAYLQAAVMRLEVIGDNFRTEMHNRTVINLDTLPVPSPSPRSIKSKKALMQRIINDKLMQIDRSFLSRSSDFYKHQVLGYSFDTEEIWINGSFANNTLNHYFPKLVESLECGRRAGQLEEQEQKAGIKEMKDISLSRSGRSEINSLAQHRSRRIRERKFQTREDIDDVFPTGVYLDSFICHDWQAVAMQRIVSLTRALDAASAILQSPLLPEESE